MKRLFKAAGKDDERINKTIQEICKRCEICKRFTKIPSRPKVAMPKAFTSNEVVSLDLKEFRKYNEFILYVVDEFNGYMKGEVINNKNPETITKFRNYSTLVFFS